MNNESLTPKEIEIVKLVAKNLTRPAIAFQQKISVETLKHHLKFIFLKTGVHNNTGLAIWAHKNGLAE